MTGKDLREIADRIRSTLSEEETVTYNDIITLAKDTAAEGRYEFKWINNNIPEKVRFKLVTNGIRVNEFVYEDHVSVTAITNGLIYKRADFATISF